MNDFNFAGKTVVVTGASMGIGAVFARELTRRGARVVRVARSRDKLEELATQREPRLGRTRGGELLHHPDCTFHDP